MQKALNISRVSEPHCAGPDAGRAAVRQEFRTSSSSRRSSSTAIAILSLNILTGASGQFSLGHSAFFAVGAYTAAILMEHGDINYILTLPFAGVVCFIFGFLFGLPALRL